MNDDQFTVLLELLRETQETLTTIRLIVEDMRPRPRGVDAMQALGLEDDE